MIEDVSKFIIIGLHKIDEVYNEIIEEPSSKVKIKNVKNRLKVLELRDAYLTPAVIVFTDKYDEVDLYNINLLQIQGYIVVDSFTDIKFMRWNREKNELREMLDMFVWWE